MGLARLLKAIKDDFTGNVIDAINGINRTIYGIDFYSRDSDLPQEIPNPARMVPDKITYSPHNQEDKKQEYNPESDSKTIRQPIERPDADKADPVIRYLNQMGHEAKRVPGTDIYFNDEHVFEKTERGITIEDREGWVKEMVPKIPKIRMDGKDVYIPIDQNRYAQIPKEKYFGEPDASPEYFIKDDILNIRFPSGQVLRIPQNKRTSHRTTPDFSPDKGPMINPTDKLGTLAQTDIPKDRFDLMPGLEDIVKR